MPKLELFAVNLHNPTHMEWTKDDRLLVSEYSAGRVMDVTNGGDFVDKQPFATGLKGPASILPLDNGQILIAENWGQRVTDISKGGSINELSIFIKGRSCPYSLHKIIKNGVDKIYISEHHNGKYSWISDITDPNNPSVYVRNIPARPGAAGLVPFSEWHNWEAYASANCVINWGGGGVNAFYVSIGGMGQILDIYDHGGDYIELIKKDKLIAWDLGRLGAIKEHPTNGLLYAVEPELGSIVAIDPSQKRNYRFDPPVVRGLMGPTCLRFSNDGKEMFVCAKGDGVIWRVTDYQ